MLILPEPRHTQSGARRQSLAIILPVSRQTQSGAQATMAAKGGSAERIRLVLCLVPDIMLASSPGCASGFVSFYVLILEAKIRGRSNLAK